MNSIIKGSLGCLIAFGLAMRTIPVASHEIVFKQLRIEHPYTFEPEVRLPARLPIYMLISNRSEQSDRLIAVETVHGASTVLAGAPLSDGGIELPAKAQTVLGPKSAYVLLRDLEETVEGYQYFPIVLVFEKAGKVEIEVYVEDRP